MNEPVAGKFLLEILTRGMYSNPIHVYREYIQNSSDSIDKAIEAFSMEACAVEELYPYICNPPMLRYISLLTKKDAVSSLETMALEYHWISQE